MNRKLIAIHAPPAPKCFETRDIWVELLVSAGQAAVGKMVRPFVNERFNPAFDFCRDCPSTKAHEMHLANRCEAPRFAREREAIRQARRQELRERAAALQAQTAEVERAA